MNILVRDWNALTTGEKMAVLQYAVSENKKKPVWSK